MAIDPINGGFTQYLIDITTLQTYNRSAIQGLQNEKKLGLISDEGKKNRIIGFNNTKKQHFRNSIIYSRG